MITKEIVFIHLSPKCKINITTTAILYFLHFYGILSTYAHHWTPSANAAATPSQVTQIMIGYSADSLAKDKLR